MQAHTHRRKRVVDGLDDERVAHPDEARRCERCNRAQIRVRQPTINKKRNQKSVTYQDSVRQKGFPRVDPDPSLRQRQDTIS